MNCPPRTLLALLPLLAMPLLPLKTSQAASSCAGFIPATITTPAQLITAFNVAQSGNCPGADTIDLNGASITFATAGFIDSGTALALPAVTTPITLTNGAVTRNSTSGFRFFSSGSGGALTLRNLTVSNGGGTGIASGGAVRVGDGSLTVLDSTFVSNVVMDTGGAVLVDGLGATLISDSVFQANQAGQSGGAIAAHLAGNVSVDRTRFLGNSSSNRGGALSATGGNPLTISNSLFAGNAAALSGAALYLSGTGFTVTGATIAGNAGSAIDVSTAAATIQNSLVWSNSGGSFAGSPFSLTYTAAEGHAGATINSGYAAEDFFVAPLTTPTAANTGMNYVPALYDWRLRPFAPAIDAAANSVASAADIDRNIRRINDANVTDTGNGTAPLVDMGAYERQDSSCSGFAFPYTLAGASNAIRRLNLRDAVRCANLNGSSDTIDLAGQTVSYDRAFATSDGVATALPAITSALTLRNGTIARDPADSTPDFRLLANAPGGDLSLWGLTLRNGNAGTASATNRGGALSNFGSLLLQQSTLSANTAHTGGALYNGAGTATIQRSTLSANVAQNSASAIFNGAQLDLSNSTVSGNSVSAGASAAIAGSGASDLTITNSTIVDNSNSSTTASAGLESRGSTKLYNSILANNTPYDCALAAGSIALSAGTSNLIETQPLNLPCGTAGSTILMADPQLGTPTGTPAWYPLTAASPAVEAGDLNNLGGATLDQAGNARVQGTTVDLGSYESPFVAQQRSIAFNATTSSAAEAAGLGNVVRVTTSDGTATTAAITASVAVSGGTATTADYQLTGTLTIPAGTPHNALVSLASAISITNDSMAEANETLRLTLSSPAGAALGAQTTLTHTINNDDVATLTIADVSRPEGNSGTSNMTFTVTLDNAVQGGLEVDYTTTALTATTADNDFVAAAGSLIFAGTAGETQTFNVTINGDTRVEANETFRVSMPSAVSIVPPGGIVITDTAIGTISNDDTATVTLADVSVSEGDSGTKLLTFTATLDSAVPGGFTVNYASANGSATTADNDYVAATGTLTFAGTAGEAQTFSVTINGDTKVEANETFSVTLNTVSNAAVNISDSATGTITNDDSARLTIADAQVIEGNSGTRNLIFTVALDNSVAGGFTVNYATSDGSATTADNDYDATSGTLTFSGTAGQTRTFIVLIRGDTRFEADETFSVALNTVSNAAVDISDTAIGTITNDDTARVTIADASVTEGDTGNTTLSFTATLDGAVAGGFSVNYATANGTASTADNDYAAASGTLTFAGTAGETQSFNVTINGDTRLETDETFSVALNTASNAGVDITDTATGTITNDDTSAVTIANASVIEGDSGTATMTFTATLGNAVQGGFSVNYATANGTATTADNDYSAASGTLTFAGTAGETQTFSVSVNGDTRLEADETFSVALNTVSNAGVTITDTAIGTITNDDTANVTIADASVTEGNSGNTTLTFTATLDNAVAGGFSVNYASANGSATTADNDYAAASGMLTFAGTAGETQTFSVSVNGDTRLEADETLSVALNSVSNASVTISDTAIGTITNDDAASVTIADASVAEGDTGTTTLTFTATLDHAVQGGFSVNYASANGTATTADNDYAAASGTLTFAGTAGETQTFSVSVNGDTRLEADETFSVALNTVSNAGVTITDTATGTITNDDAASVTIADASVTEGNTGTTTLTFTATLDNAVPGGFIVKYETANGSATTADNDYAAASGVLTFAGSAGETQTISVTVNGDTRLEADETFSLALNNPSNAAVNVSDTGTGTITNDDTASVTIADASVTEGNTGTTTLSFTATLDHAVAGGFSVNYATANGTATTTDNDYAAASGTLTFAGSAGETQTISVTVNGDTRLEADETFSVALNNPSNAAVNVSDTATGTITNDDAASVTIADASVTEGNTGTTTLSFTATLDHAVAGGFSVNYATANGTATTADNDYAAASGTLTFAGTAGETQTISVTVNGDTRLEPDETLSVALSNASNTSVNISDSAIGTITNDDAAGLTIANASVTEGNAGTTALTFTVTLNSAVSGGFTANYATANGSATTADNDYAATSGTLTFAGTAGETQTFAVNVNGDARVEADETFSVTLSALSNAAVTAPGAATGTITNDDSAGILVTPTAGLVTTEAGGSATFTVALTSQPGADVGIALSSSDTGEGNVSPAALNFTAADWNVAQTVTVTGADDASVDGSVVYTIVTAAATSADAHYAGIDASDVAVSNQDDDGASLRIADVTLAEGDSGTTAFVFTVTLDGAVAGGVRVNYATADDSALAPADYSTTSGTLAFAGTDGETQTISVPVTGDTLVEGDERFRVVLSGADPAVVALSRAEAIGTISEDDAAAQLAATKRVSQPGTSTQPAIYSLVVSNTGSAAQADAVGSDELVDVLPPSLALQSASASSGTVVADLASNTVRWNGALAAGASATIEIRATVTATTAGPISNRAQVNYDSDGDGSNDAAALSDDPGTPGDDATVFFFVPAGVVTPAPVPGLGLWGMLVLMLGFAALGAGAVRKRRGAAV